MIWWKLCVQVSSDPRAPGGQREKLLAGVLFISFSHGGIIGQIRPLVLSNKFSGVVSFTHLQNKNFLQSGEGNLSVLLQADQQKKVSKERLTLWGTYRRTEGGWWWNNICYTEADACCSGANGQDSGCRASSVFWDLLSHRVFTRKYLPGCSLCTQVAWINEPLLRQCTCNLSLLWWRTEPFHICTGSVCSKHVVGMPSIAGEMQLEWRGQDSCRSCWQSCTSVLWMLNLSLNICLSCCAECWEE